MTLVRMYVYARKKQEAMKIFENVFHKITSQILEMKIVACEPYWKIDGQYHMCRRKFNRSTVYRWLHKYATRYLLCLYNTYHLIQLLENILGWK